MGRALVLCVLLLWAAPAQAQPGSGRVPPPDPDDLQIELLLGKVETAVSRADRAAWQALLSANADRDAADDFFNEIVPQGITRVVLRERDRQRLPGALPGNGYSLVVEVFIETGARGRISTWQLDIRRPEGEVELAPGETPWRVVGQDRLSQVDALYRLALSPDKRFTAQNLVVSSVDFELRLPSGDVFVAETPEGITAMVLIGDGTMVFSPTPKTEQGQVRLFAGSDAIETKFESAFVRFNPFDLDSHVSHDGLVAASTDPRQLARARTIFDDEVGRTFSLDLSDLSRETWSIMPQAGDFVAEVRTRRFRTLTYARASGEPEDVSVFSRERKKNISIYASEQKLASRGVFYDEDDLSEIDVLDYDVDVQFVTRPRVARRAHQAQAAGEGLRARGDHAAPGRAVHGVVGGQRQARTAAVPARQEPERAGDQPAVGGGPRLRTDADHRLSRARAPAGNRRRIGGGARRTAARRRAGAAARGRAGGAGRTQLADEQPHLLVPAGAGLRLRHRHRAGHRAGGVRRRRIGRVGAELAGDAGPGRRRARAIGCCGSSPRCSRCATSASW